MNFKILFHIKSVERRFLTMEKFRIDSTVLANISIPDVKLTPHSESVAALALTTNCGCGGRCLSSTT